MSLINWEINLILNWSSRCLIIGNPNARQEPIFTNNKTKLYIPIVALSI